MSRQFTVTAADTQLHGVDTLGHEPPLLFLNGGFSTQQDWKPVIRQLDGKYRTVTFDARGRGRSGTSSDYSLRGAIDDVDRVIEATALRRPVLIGWSHGATVALSYAAECPQLVRGLVLIDGAYPVSVLDETGKQRVRGHFRRIGWSMRIRAVFGRSARMTPQECAEVAIETDEVNGELLSDWAALRCPTALVVEETNTMRAAAIEAVAGADQVTVLATTAGNPARILAQDPAIVAAAIEDVRRRSCLSGNPSGTSESTKYIVAGERRVTHTGFPEPVDDLQRAG